MRDTKGNRESQKVKKSNDIADKNYLASTVAKKISVAKDTQGVWGPPPKPSTAVEFKKGLN